MARTLPTWGTITAAPHEHLIVLRNGRVIRSAQGGSVFRWPRDSVALVDTSVKRLQFTADQVTREKTGVQVTGLAVFRVVEPELAYRMLNLEQPEAYQQILQEMFVGATRRLVANLTLEECMTRRKDALAQELMAEVAPVVQGRGQAGDATDRGWGVAIDTIEIQDVRVLSEEVFSRLQAPYREELALGAARARAAVATQEAHIAAQKERLLEQHRRELMELEEQRIAAQRERDRQRSAHEEDLKRLAQEAEVARREAQAASAVRTAELQARAERVAADARLETLRQERQITDSVSPAHLQEILLTTTLPEMARAYRDTFDHVTVTSADGNFLGLAVSQTLASLKSYGIDLATLLPARPEGSGP